MGSFDTSRSFLFIFAGRIKRGLTQIFAKKNRIKQSAIIRDNLHLAKKRNKYEENNSIFLGLTFCATFLFAQDIERNVKERLTVLLQPIYRNSQNQHS